MGQVVFIAFFAAGAMCLSILGYATGYYDALEKMEEEDEAEKKKKHEDDLAVRVRRYGRRYKRIDYRIR